MMDKCCTGTFEIVRTQEECDFWAATHGKEFCDKLVGKKLCLKITEICEGKMAFHVTSPDCPELSHFMVCCLGQEQCSNFPILGKCKIKSCKTGDCCFETCLESECGTKKMQIKDTFTNEGLCRVVTINGKTNKEMWKRVICENGYYRVCKTENAKEFMLARGMPDKVACLINDLKMHWKNCGTGFELKRKFGEHKMKTCAKFDEEFCETVPECGEEKCIFTKVGCGKYKCFVKDDKGGKVEWCWEFCDDGLTIKGKCLKTGMTCCVCLKKFTPIEGSWKMLSCHNIKENCIAMGMPAEKACQMANECVTLCIEDHCPVFRWNWMQKTSPMDFCFKLNEECDYFDAQLQQHGKILVSCCDNKWMVLCKYSDGSVWENCITVTDNFMIFKCCCKGMKCPPMVYVFERC